MARSTVGNIFRRSIVPSLATLETICQDFGITLSQFFTKESLVEPTPVPKALFDHWVLLTPAQKSALLQLLRAMEQPPLLSPPMHQIFGIWMIPTWFVQVGTLGYTRGRRKPNTSGSSAVNILLDAQKNS